MKNKLQTELLNFLKIGFVICWEKKEFEIATEEISVEIAE